MTNEPVGRLADGIREALNKSGIHSGDLLVFTLEEFAEALATERRATVERIRAKVSLQAAYIGEDFLAILDEEAAK